MVSFAPATPERYRRVLDDFEYGDISRDQIIGSKLETPLDVQRFSPNFHGDVGR